MENLGLKIEQPIFICPKHGEINITFNSTIEGIEGDWCLKCYVEWVDKNIPKVEKKK